MVVMKIPLFGDVMKTLKRKFSGAGAEKSLITSALAPTQNIGHCVRLLIVFKVCDLLHVVDHA